MAFVKHDESLEIQEQYVAFMIECVLENCDYALDVLGRDKDLLKSYTELPYPRISYDDALSHCYKKMDLKILSGAMTLVLHMKPLLRIILASQFSS